MQAVAAFHCALGHPPALDSSPTSGEQVRSMVSVITSFMRIEGFHSQHTTACLPRLAVCLQERYVHNAPQEADNVQMVVPSVVSSLDPAVWRIEHVRVSLHLLYIWRAAACYLIRLCVACAGPLPCH